MSPLFIICPSPENKDTISHHVPSFLKLGLRPTKRPQAVPSRARGSRPSLLRGSIVSAVEKGRAIYSGIQKFVGESQVAMWPVDVASRGKENVDKA